MNKTNWKSVITFYVIACLWSWPFLWWRDMRPDSWRAIEIPQFLKTWSFMWGPGIAAAICLYMFRKSHTREMTFAGTSLWRGILFYLTLPAIISLVHLDAGYLKFGLLGFVAILGEELGWRGFLQDTLKVKSDYSKAAIIGSMWELWHFTAHTANGAVLAALIRVSIFIAVLTIISFIILKLTKPTKSLFIPIAIHMAFNAAFEFERGWQTVVICIPIWFLIYRNWIKISHSPIGA